MKKHEEHQGKHELNALWQQKSQTMREQCAAKQLSRTLFKLKERRELFQQWGIDLGNSLLKGVF